MEESIGMDLIRSIFSALDSAIYSLISLFYNTLMDLANSTFINTSDVSAVSIRIYSLLGIFMLFKVSFSMINFIINPDAISDKDKGGAKLIKNVIITLFLVIMVPFGFDFLRDAQSAILNDQIIPKMILGTESEADFSNASLELYIDSGACNEVGSAKTEDIGDYISLLAFRPFFQIERKPGVGIVEDYDRIKQSYCSGTKTYSMDENLGIERTATVSSLLESNVYNSPTGRITTNHLYTVNYKWFLSTAVGVVVALLFLSFCFDTAVRMIKLAFLELIAPIPIISYIDPKSGKDGMFKKWYKEVVKTWASLFIRLAAVFFAIFIISLLADNGVTINDANGDTRTANMWIDLFILIGALMFAKQLPKLIEDALGIKMSGSLNLNPFKNIKDNALGGKTLEKALGATTGAVGGGIAGAMAGRQVGSGLRGSLVGAFGGLRGGYKTPSGAFAKNMDQMYKNLTGNDMNKMSVDRLIMGGQKGKEKVDEIKAHLKSANAQLREQQSNLNVASSISSDSGTKLRARGINLTNESLSSTLAKLKDNELSLENNYKSSKSTYDSEMAKYNSAKEIVERQKSRPKILDQFGKEFISPEFTQAKNLVDKFEYNNSEYKTKIESDYMKANKENNENKEMISNISSYTKSKEEEIEYRKAINEIEKDIKTMSDEKGQRQKFYQVDTSPKDSVEKTIKKYPKLKDEPPK